APRDAAAALRTQTRRLLAPAAGFAFGAAPMLLGLASALQAAQGLFAAGGGAGVRHEKLATLVRTLDGSYFDRLMRAGGSFERMFDGAEAASGPFLAIYAIAVVALGVWLALPAQRARPQRGIAFVLATALLSSLAIFVTPRAVRIHHVLGVYPFPQLVVAAAIVTLAGAGRSPARRVAAACVAALALLGGARASLATFDTIERTHGKGRWSDAVSALAAELAADPRALAVSLDWGFDARLRFVDRGLALREPIWRLSSQSAHQTPWSFEGDGHVRYLLWDRDFAVFTIGPAFLDAVRELDPARVEIRRWLDRDGDPAFVSVRIAGPHQIVYRGMQGARPFEVVLR
ncbi:MAG TPA: hypothetical protein VII78_07950, partial [Myxococcota bacterium]